MSFLSGHIIFALQHGLHWSICASLMLCALTLTPPAQAQESLVWNAPTSWSQLTPSQQTALHPLEREWGSIDIPRRQKWLGVASRFDRMSEQERERTQQRMADWARMSPKERNEARANFQTVRQQLSADERQQRWDAYQALPEEQRRDLAAQSKAKPVMAKNQARAAAPATGPKVNTVPNPISASNKAKPLTPGIAQAKPGATTNSMAAKPSPPLHQPTGLPKVAATPEFVDTITLLPQRGAQASAADARAKR